MSALETNAVRAIIDKAEQLGVPVPDEVRAILDRTCDSSWAAGRWAEQHPDDDLGFCCWGVVNAGPSACTCWVAVFDVEQQPAKSPPAGQELAARTARCSDCAFRRDSPEQRDDWTREYLLSLPGRGETHQAVTRSAILSGTITPFWCHDGLRRPTYYEHQPNDVSTGRRVEAPPDDWKPLVDGFVPYQLDGQPGLVCAGWAQHRAKEARQRGSS